MKTVNPTNDVYNLVGHKVSAATAGGEIFKTGILTCKNAATNEYRITAPGDRGLKGFYFYGENVARVNGFTVHFKSFV